MSRVQEAPTYWPDLHLPTLLEDREEPRLLDPAWSGTAVWCQVDDTHHEKHDIVKAAHIYRQTIYTLKNRLTNAPISKVYLMSLCNNKNSCCLSIAMFIVSVADHNQDFRFQKSVMFFQPTAIFMEHTLDVLHWYFILEFMWKQISEMQYLILP